MSDHLDILAWRAELAVIGFEGTFTQIKAAARFLELGEYSLAVETVERAMPFWSSALDEMRVIRAAVRSDQLTGEAAAEYRANRDRSRPLTKSEVSA